MFPIKNRGKEIINKDEYKGNYRYSHLLKDVMKNLLEVKEHLTNLTDIKCINEVDLQEIIDEQRRKENTDQVIKKDSQKFTVVYIINVFVLK